MATRTPAAAQADEDTRPGGGGVPAVLGAALLDAATGRISGVLHVTGDPGGSVFLADGRVTGVDTSGAPGPEAVLLRSGRVLESAWSRAFTAAAAAGLMGDELVKRELLGAGELEALLRVIAADGLFAIAAGQVDDCKLDPAAPVDWLLPLRPGAEVGWLLAETSRRLAVLASLANRIVPGRDRVTASRTAPESTGQLGEGEEQLLAMVNGRRTARDLGFALGRGVYAVTLHLAWMSEADLVFIDPRRSAPRTRSGGDGATASGGGSVSGDGTAPGGTGTAANPALPRRRRLGRGGGPAQGK